MRRIALRTGLAVLVTAAALVPQAMTPAQARSKNGDGPTFRYPSELSETELRILLQSSQDAATVIFEKGDHVFSPQLFVFNRSNLTLCGETGRSGDVSIQSDGGGAGAGATAAILVEQSRSITFRDLTIVATAASAGQGMRLNAQLATDFSSFVDGIRIEGCEIDAEFPIVATASAENLTVSKSRIVCRRADGFGLVWGDGRGLLVTKTTFDTAPGVAALSGVFVQGAGAQFSEGERTRSVILTKNKIVGDFLRGFDIADVNDARIRKNKFAFPGQPSRPFGGTVTGRVGVLVRRGESSSLPIDYEVTKNKVRNAYYGAWILNGGQGVLRKNDFRRCGAPDRDQFFREFGGGIRLTLFSANCQIEIVKNDLRNLRSPEFAQVDPDDPGSEIGPVPAIVVVPSNLSDACFADGDGGNKTSKGRELFLEPEEVE
jgi:hypothetical protein